MSSGTTVTSRPRIIGASVAALVVLLVLSALYTVPHVHNDLTQEALRHTAVELGVADSFEELPHKKVELLRLLEPVGIVNLTVSGHHATIAGAARPQEEIDRLVAAGTRWGVSKVTYEVDPSLAPEPGTGNVAEPTPTTTGTTPDGAVAADPEVTVTVVDTRMSLIGTVATEADHQALLGAAVDAYGAPRVDDQIVVADSDGAARAATGVSGLVDGRVAALARLLETTGRATMLDAVLTPTDLTVTAIAADVAAKSDMDAAIASAGAPGFESTGVVSVAGLDPVTTPSTPNSGGTIDQQVTALQAELDALAAVQTRSVFFATGSSDLTAEANAVLDSVADAMSRYPLPLVDMGGHTDSDGNDADNLALSQARANAVLAGLVARAVGTDRLAAVGYGETQPKADNATPEGRAANRRVEFTVKKGS